MTETTSRRSPGRPRDPDVDTRVLAAAREVYGERGWSGFTLDEVARRSRVSKGALYLRWPDKATLIIDAVRTQAPSIAAIDTGSLREDLVTFACQWCRFVMSADGAMLSRLGIDQRFFPEIQRATEAAPFPKYIADTISIVLRGIERGEIPRGTSASLIGDLVAGAVSNHVRATPTGTLTTPQIEKFARNAVDVVLAGVRNL